MAPHGPTTLQLIILPQLVALVTSQTQSLSSTTTASVTQAASTSARPVFIGTVTTLAGNSSAQGYADGVGVAAKFGNLYGAGIALASNTTFALVVGRAVEGLRWVSFFLTVIALTPCAF